MSKFFKTYKKQEYPSQKEQLMDIFEKLTPDQLDELMESAYQAGIGYKLMNPKDPNAHADLKRQMQRDNPDVTDEQVTKLLNTTPDIMDFKK